MVRSQSDWLRRGGFTARTLAGTRDFLIVEE